MPLAALWGPSVRTREIWYMSLAMTTSSSEKRTDKRKAKAKPKARRGRGRPTRYTPEVAADICTRLAEGESLRSICDDAAIPARSTVLGWLFDGEHEEFIDLYACASEAQAEGRADEIVDIADDVSSDFTKDKDGKAVVDHENIQRSRLRVDARKWIAAKLLPKRYGDKLQHTGDGGGPIRVRPDLSKFTDEELNALERILGRTVDAR